MISAHRFPRKTPGKKRLFLLVHIPDDLSKLVNYIGVNRPTIIGMYYVYVFISIKLMFVSDTSELVYVKHAIRNTVQICYPILVLIKLTAWWRFRIAMGTGVDPGSGFKILKKDVSSIS